MPISNSFILDNLLQSNWINECLQLGDSLYNSSRHFKPSDERPMIWTLQLSDANI